MNNNVIKKNDKDYWNANADLWFGTTALPKYSMRFATDEDLHLF